MNWRRVGLFLAIAGMETCWIVAWSRVLLGRSNSVVEGLSWWTVFALYLIALTAALTLGRLELQRGPWLLAGSALFSSLLMLWLNLGGVSSVLPRPADPSTATAILTLILGLGVWARALRVPEQAGDLRSILRHFQVGIVVMVLVVLVSHWSQDAMSDLVVAFFGFGLLATALTRIDEVARTETGGAAPFDRKWAATLGATLAVAGFAALLAARLLTIGTVRWLLRPLALLLNLVVYVVVFVTAELVMQILPLFRWLLGDLTLQDLEQSVENFRQLPLPPEQEEVPEPGLLSPQLQEMLVTSLIVILILIALWLVVRSFRRWRMAPPGTPGAVRETVAADGSLAEDLLDYLRDQWRRLRQADLRRLFRRLGVGSIRAIYASLLALMAALEQPRQPEQTPYEFEPVAGQALPERSAELHAITEAYVRARYGEVEIDTQELARLQEAWHRVQSDGQELVT